THFIIYAIREIVFVVIGILIAVSINNWNEARKQNIELTNILLNVKEDIQNDIEKIEEVLTHYNNEEPMFDNVINSKYTVQDYESNPALGFLILGYPEISFNKRGVEMLEEFSGNISPDKEALTEEIIKFYNEQLHEIKVDDDLRSKDFLENFSYWKNNTDWWADYVQLKITEDFIDYALNSKDYKNRVATAKFYAYTIYLPEIIKFKEKGLEIISQIEATEQ
ncbi:MAG: DUF6090 family protein, partial [Bacteroidota bacterium]